MAMSRRGFVVCLFLCSGAIKALSQDVSVDPSSGNAVVTIPLHTLTYGSIMVPINLVHSGNALKVDEGEGDAGFGWNLSCNYGVFREVRGLPDEVSGTKIGWLSAGASIQTFTPTSNDNYSSADWSDESDDWSTLNNFVRYVDSEPDIYTISGPNLFARFVYDGSGAIRLLEYQDIEITPLSSADGFTIKNNIGHVYQFTTKERVTRKTDAYRDAVADMFTTEYDYYKDSSVPQFTNTWYLASVTDENGLSVNFNYTAQNLTRSVQFRTRIKTISNEPDTLYIVESDLIPQSLTSITAGSYAVTLDRTSEKLLNTVVVSESQLADSYKYAFTYQTAVAAAGRGGLHYFLKEIKLFSMSNCNTEVPYKFSYQGVSETSGVSSSAVDFPWGTHYSQDIWGFYNGVDGPSNTLNVVPTLNFYSALTDGRRFVFYTISGETNTPMAGAYRDTRSNKIGIGALVQITYPAGGRTKIEWERNKYLDSLGGKVLFGPGMRVKSITTSGGDVAYNRSSNPASSYHDIVKTYKYERSETDTTTSGVIFYPPSYGLSTGTQLIRTLENQAPESQIAYRRIKESISGYGYKVYIYSYPARYPFTTYSTDWTATKSRIARNPSSSHAGLSNVKNGYYIFPFAPNPNYTFSQGLLTSVTEFSQGGVMMRNKKTYYSRINPALASVYGVRFENFADCNCFHFSRYQVITGTTSVVTQEVVRTGDDQSTPIYSTDTYDYYYNSDVANNNFLLQSIKHTMADGSVSQRYIKYIKDFAPVITSPASGDIMANAIKLMATARRHGEVVETYTVFTPAGGSAVYQDASLQLYKDFGSGKVYPYRRYSFPNGATLTPATAIPGSTQTFSSDSDYFLGMSNDDFDSNSNVVSLSDDDKNLVAMHYAQNLALPPVAKFNRATAKQTVYDGFEFATGRNLSGVTSTVTPGWTGERAATLTTTGIFSHSAVQNNGKPYRVSCYVKAATNATVTFKFLDPSTQADLFTTSLSYAPSPLNTWVYLEGVLNVTSASVATVKLKITASATVTIDDIIVMPKDASVNTQTFLAFKGPTSQTDDRGYSTAVTYDDFGRRVNVFDRQRNLVELDEYISKGAKPAWINSGFSTSDVVTGVSFTANAKTNCFANAQYQWKLDGVAVGTNSSTLTTTVDKPGQHSLSLTVTNPASGVSSTTLENLCVAINSSTQTFTLTIDNPSNPGSPNKCNVGLPMKFTVIPLTYCDGQTPQTKVLWEYSDDDVTYTPFGDNSNTATNGGLGIGPDRVGVFYIRVTVFQTCPGGQRQECNGSTITGKTKKLTINQVDCTN